MKRYFIPDYVGAGGPDKPIPPANASIMSNAGYFPSASHGAIATKMDIRDAIAGIVGRGNKNIKNDDDRHDYALLVGSLGQGQAQKLLNHLMIFNQRPDQLKKPFEQRLQSLYDMGSGDKDVDELLKTTRGVGYGPIPGARESRNLGVMTAEGSPTFAASPSKMMTNTKL